MSHVFFKYGNIKIKLEKALSKLNQNILNLLIKKIILIFRFAELVLMQTLL